MNNKKESLLKVFTSGFRPGVATRVMDLRNRMAKDIWKWVVGGSQNRMHFENALKTVNCFGIQSYIIFVALNVSLFRKVIA